MNELHNQPTVDIHDMFKVAREQSHKVDYRQRDMVNLSLIESAFITYSIYADNAESEEGFAKAIAKINRCAPNLIESTNRFFGDRNAR